MAMSVPAMISPEWTFTQRPLRMTRSAGLRPIATSTRCVAISAQGLGFVALADGFFAMKRLLFARLCQAGSDLTSWQCRIVGNAEATDSTSLLLRNGRKPLLRQ